MFRKGYDPENREIGRDKVKYKGVEYLISTVDLGIDHRFGKGAPLYYETMVFEIEGDEINWIERYINRYSTKEEAKKGHKKVLKAFKNKKIAVNKYDYDYWDFRIINNA